MSERIKQRTSPQAITLELLDEVQALQLRANQLILEGDSAQAVTTLREALHICEQNSLGLSLQAEITDHLSNLERTDILKVVNSIRVEARGRVHRLIGGLLRFLKAKMANFRSVLTSRDLDPELEKDYRHELQLFVMDLFASLEGDLELTKAMLAVMRSNIAQSRFSLKETQTPPNVFLQNRGVESAGVYKDLMRDLRAYKKMMPLEIILEELQLDIE